MDIEQGQDKSNPSRYGRRVLLPAYLHTALRMLAAARQVPMNALVVMALEQFVQPGMKELNVFVDGWMDGKRGDGLFDPPDPKKEKEQQDDLKRKFAAKK